MKLIQGASAAPRLGRVIGLFGSLALTAGCGDDGPAKTGVSIGDASGDLPPDGGVSDDAGPGDAAATAGGGGGDAGSDAAALPACSSLTNPLYVMSGDGGELTVGSDKIRFGPEQAIYLPEDQPHAVKFHGDSKTVMLQIYAPAGPEQRFKGKGKAKSE